MGEEKGGRRSFYTEPSRAFHAMSSMQVSGCLRSALVYRSLGLWVSGLSPARL